MGVAGACERWRLHLEKAPFCVPHGGWVLPSWSSHLEIRRRHGAAAAHYIAPARAVTGLAISPTAFLAAAARPALEFSRSRNMDDLLDGAVALLEAIEESTELM